MSNLLKTWKPPRMKDIVSCQSRARSHVGVGDQIWSPCLRNLKAVVLENDIHEKQWKNRVALDQSNNDPAGRAEQLKESPGERWELLTATEDLLSPRFTLSLAQPRLEQLCTDENIAGNTEKKALITERGGVMGGGGEMKIPWASETFPVQFNMLHQLFLICCFLHKIVRFYIKPRFHRGLRLNPVQVTSTTVKRGNLAENNQLGRMFSKRLIEIMTLSAND